MQQAATPTDTDLTPYLSPGSYEDLEALLTYTWPEEKLNALQKRGVHIEIFLGGQDAIVNAPAANDYFKRFGESWLFKPYGHLLK